MPAPQPQRSFLFERMSSHCKLESCPDLFKMKGRSSSPLSEPVCGADIDAAAGGPPRAQAKGTRWTILFTPRVPALGRQHLKTSRLNFHAHILTSASRFQLMTLAKCAQTLQDWRLTAPRNSPNIQVWTARVRPLLVASPYGRRAYSL